MPKFSIVIPTRERAATLGPCLATCLAESFDDVEFVVQDNASSDGTEALVRGLSDKRVRYFRNSERVSMRINFENAVRNARGDYIVMFGDDDGVVPGALARLDRVTQRTDYDFIAWPTVDYFWPGVDASRPGHLRLRRRNMFRPALDIDLDARRRDFFAAVPIAYREMPKIYHGCISRGLIERLRQADNTLFQYDIPDVYAQAAFLVEARRGLSLGHVLTINGASKQSNGTSAFTHAKPSLENYRGTAYGTFIDETRADQGAPVAYNPAILSHQYYFYICLHILEIVLARKLPIDHDAWMSAVVQSILASKNFNAMATSAPAMSEIDARVLAAVRAASAAPGAVHEAASGNGDIKRKSQRSETILATGTGATDTVLEAAQVLANAGAFIDRDEHFGWQLGQLARWTKLVHAERQRVIA